VVPQTFDLTRGRLTLRPRTRSDGVQLTARSLKIVLLLDPAALGASLQPYATVEDRVPFLIAVEGRRLTADFPPRAVRKVLATIAEHGVDGIACMVQGRLLGDNSIGDAGLSAQPKAKTAQYKAAGVLPRRPPWGGSRRHAARHTSGRRYSGF
jgi:hypothetical protein